MYTHKKQQYNKQGYYAYKKNKMNLNITIDNLLYNRESVYSIKKFFFSVLLIKL